LVFRELSTKGRASTNKIGDGFFIGLFQCHNQSNYTMALLQLTKEQKGFINKSFVICAAGLALSLAIVNIFVS